MSFKPIEFAEDIAHITDQQGNVFQVLNENKTDWDEAATVKQRDTYYATQQ